MDKTELLSSKLKNKEIAEMLGVSIITVVRMRKTLGISSSNRGAPKGERPHTKTGWFRPCDVCGKDMWVRPSETNRKYCSRECMSVSEEQRNKMRSIDRSYMLTEEYRNKMSKDTTPAYKRYANRVHKLTQKIYEENEHIINPEGHQRTLCGTDGGYQLDHIIPVRYGFDNNIPAEELARIDNLRMLPWKQNLLKRDRIDG